jgi:hypothetical protein
MSAVATPAIVDNMVLAVFVDSGNAALLSALSGGEIRLSPSILDSSEWPFEGRQPISEFLRGMARFSGLDDPLSQLRYERRERYLKYPAGLWTPAEPNMSELALAATLASREERQRAREKDSSLRVARVDPGEAECAALALSRGWEFWSDDSGMVPLLRTLYPAVHVERTCALVARCINDGLLTFAQGHELYEVVFKGQLELRSRAVLEWRSRRASCVLPTS